MKNFSSDFSKLGFQFKKDLTYYEKVFNVICLLMFSIKSWREVLMKLKNKSILRKLFILPDIFIIKIFRHTRMQYFPLTDDSIRTLPIEFKHHKIHQRHQLYLEVFYYPLKEAGQNHQRY